MKRKGKSISSIRRKSDNYRYHNRIRKIDDYRIESDKKKIRAIFLQGTILKNRILLRNIKS